MVVIVRPETERFTVARTETAPGTVVLAIAGEVDICNARGLREEIGTILAESAVRRLTLDFAALDYLDSSGVGALVAGLRLAENRRVGFTVVNPRREVLRALTILGLGPALSPGGQSWR